MTDEFMVLCKMRSTNSFPKLQCCFKAQLIMLLLIANITWNTEASPSEKLACHELTNEVGKHTPSMLKQIDDKLDSLYTAIRTNAILEDVCNHSVEINETEITLTHLLEKFEVRRSFYNQGMWGYCASEGADKLMEDVDKLLTIAEDPTTPIVLCDRDQLLDCHPRFKKCQCINDMRDYRNIVSVQWNDEEGTSGKDTRAKSLGWDGCVLAAGSNCPVVNESPFLCFPGTNCLTKKGLKPCVLKNLQSSISPSLLPRSKRTVSRKYSLIKDTFPNLHCQCYGYENPH